MSYSDAMFFWIVNKITSKIEDEAQCVGPAILSIFLHITLIFINSINKSEVKALFVFITFYSQIPYCQLLEII